VLNNCVDMLIWQDIPCSLEILTMNNIAILDAV